jgi:plastocyanin
VVERPPANHRTPEIRPSAAARQFDIEPHHRWRPWLWRAGLLLAGLAFLATLTLFLLALADYNIAGNGSPNFNDRARWTIDRGDHLHYAVHLAAGRIFDLCPCTRRAADAQYYYAKFHAITPRQQQVLKDSRPGGLGGLPAYILGPFGVGMDWIGDGVSWLSGNHPARAVSVALDQYQMNPPVIQVLRGTTVTWRNVDELGEAHTVTADPGQVVKFDSGFLEPDESFSFTFTERGRYTYYCTLHGEPGKNGMAGVVVVD